MHILGIDCELTRQLGAALPHNRCLESLVLNHNHIDDQGVKHLCDGLRNHPSIKSLWLSTNLISDQGVKYLCGLVSRNKSLLEINLCTKWPTKTWSQAEQQWFPHVTSAGAYLFAMELERGCNLTSLSLSDQRICDEGARALFRSMKGSILRALHVAGASLSDACCNALSAALADNMDLEQLDVSRNAITDEGCVLIAKGLATNTVLRTLDFSQNVSGDRGMAALFDALTTNTTISTLNTHGNPSSDDRAERTASERYSHMKATLVGLGASSSIDQEFGRKVPMSANGTLSFESSISPWEVGPLPWDVSSLSVSSRPGVADPSLSAFALAHPASGRSSPLHPMRPNSSLRFDRRVQWQGDLTEESLANAQGGPSDVASVESKDDESSLAPSQTTKALSASTLTGPGSRRNPLLKVQRRRRKRLQIKTIPLKRDIEFEIGYRERVAYKRDVAPLSVPATRTSPRRDRQKQSSSLLSLSSLQHPDLSQRRPYNELGMLVPSKGLGKVLGVPYLGTRGATPVRRGLSPSADGNHLFYMRVVSPADPPEAKPYPVLLVRQRMLFVMRWVFVSVLFYRWLRIDGTSAFELRSCTRTRSILW